MNLHIYLDITNCFEHVLSSDVYVKLKLIENKILRIFKNKLEDFFDLFMIVSGVGPCSGMDSCSAGLQGVQY